MCKILRKIVNTMLIVATLCLTGCSQTGCNRAVDTLFGNSTKFAFFPAVFDLKADSQTGRLSAKHKDGTVYFFKGDLCSEQLRGIYRVAPHASLDTAELFMRCDTVSGLCVDENYLYYATATEPVSPEMASSYNKIVKVPLQGGSEVVTTFAANHTTRLLRTQDGLYSLAYFLSGDPVSNGINQYNYFSFSDIATPPINLVESAKDFTKIKLSSEDVQEEYSFQRQGNTMLSYVSMDCFEVCDLVTGDSISSSDILSHTFFREEMGELVGYRLSYDSGAPLMKFNSAKVTLLPLPSDMPQFNYSHSVCLDNEILMFNSYNYFGLYINHTGENILSFDLLTGEYSVKCPIAKNEVVLFADKTQYAVMEFPEELSENEQPTAVSGKGDSALNNGDTTSVKLDKKVKIYQYTDTEKLHPIVIDGFGEAFACGVEVAGDYMFFYRSCGYDFEHIERLYLYKAVKFK